MEVPTKIIPPPDNKPTVPIPEESTAVEETEAPTTASGSKGDASPTLDEPAVTTTPAILTPTPSPEPTPPANPASTTSPEAPVFTSAREFAKKLNKEWSTLTPDSPCTTTGEDSCIDGNPFTCNEGTWRAKEACPDGTSCFALPHSETEVEVACFSQDVADHRLGKGDDDDNVRPEQPKGGNDGGENTSEVEEPLQPEPTTTLPPQEPSPSPEPTPEEPTPATSDEPELVTTTTRTSTTFVTKTATRPPAEELEPEQPEPTNTVVESIIDSSPEPSPEASSPPQDAENPEASPNSPVAPPTSTTPVSPIEKDATPTAEPTYNDIWGGRLPDFSSFFDLEPTAATPEASSPPANNDDDSTGKSDDGEDGEDGNELPEASLTVTEGIPTPSTEAQAPQGKKEDADFATTIFVGGTPTVEYYFTVTETATEKETVTTTATMILQPWEG